MPSGARSSGKAPGRFKARLLSRVIGAIFPFCGYFWRVGSSRQTLSPAITVQTQSVPTAGGGLPPRAPRTKHPGRPGPGARGRGRVQAASRATRPGTMEASAMAVTGRCAPRPGPHSPRLRRHIALRSAGVRESTRLAAREGTERFEPAATRPRPRGPRAAPAGGSSCGRARPGPPASPSRSRLQLEGDSGRGQGPGLHAALQAQREHARTKARGPQTGKVRGGPWGVRPPDEGGGGHTRRDTWERQTPL